MKELIFATSNKNKLIEVRQILSAQYKVIGLKDIGWTEEIDEPYMTLKENAIHKAQTIFDNKGITCFAEDTGLEVSALNGEPGVFTARYAGPEKDSIKNMNLLLSNLKNIEDRSAQFRSAIAIYDGEGILFNGILRGKISHELSGINGFGYDPIFIPEGYEVTMAELRPEIKNKISHRGRAIRDMVDYLLA